MKRTVLRIGKIPFTNLFPIFYMLQKECDCSHYEFVEGVPSMLNRMLRNGEIDLSPSSSIEYLRYKDRYVFIDGHSLSSKGPIESIFLISRMPIERLEGRKILTSSQSDTSVVLLDIILKKFYKVECFLESTNETLESLLNKADAFLCIGDDALKAKKTVNSNTPSLTLPPRGGGQGWGGIYLYDLGDLWFRNTGLPFVFALWIVRKDSLKEKAEILEKFTHDLNKAKTLAREHFDKIAQALKPLLFNRHALLLTEKEILSYWKGISFDLKEEHKKGLELFRNYSEELGLL
ncbi:MAG TPA: menaquinone biosynthesis protein [Thermodesulfovibrionales bacterium]|nr:menaquinone biosynthesis protein [Thermodesulfovibrionales bacterium]